jgi:ligand-binding sensor domain-containing protein
MSTAIHDFFTSELNIFPSNYVVTVVSDNAKPLTSFEYNKEHPSLKRSNMLAPSTLGSYKKDYRWGEETPSQKSQWDCAPAGHARHNLSRPAISDSANAADTSSNEVLSLSPVSVCSLWLQSTRRTSSLRDEDWRSQKLPIYMCDKQEDIIIKIIKPFGHLVAMEIKQKGGNAPPQKPHRRKSINSKAA